MLGNRGKNTFPRSTKTTSSKTIGGTLKESSSVDLSPNSNLGHAVNDAGFAVRLVKPDGVDVDKRMDKATLTRGAGAKEGKLSDWADLRNRYGRKCARHQRNFWAEQRGRRSIIPVQSLLLLITRSKQSDTALRRVLVRRNGLPCSHFARLNKLVCTKAFYSVLFRIPRSIM